MLATFRTRFLAPTLLATLLLAASAGAQPVSHQTCPTDLAVVDDGGGGFTVGGGVPGGPGASTSAGLCVGVADEDVLNGDLPAATVELSWALRPRTQDVTTHDGGAEANVGEDGISARPEPCWFDGCPHPWVPIIFVGPPPRDPHNPPCLSCPAYTVAVGTLLVVEGEGVTSLRVNGVEMLP